MKHSSALVDVEVGDTVGVPQLLRTAAARSIDDGKHPKTPGHAWVEVNLNNLRANARTLLARAGYAQLLAVLKANAYGLGATQVAKALEPLNPWGYAVANVDEAINLRRARISRPILVLAPAVASTERVYRRYQLRPVVDDAAFLLNWDGPFHTEIDTGMSRNGVRWDAPADLGEIARARPEGVFTHFHSADLSRNSMEEQLQRFRLALSITNYRPPLCHVANSAAVFSLESHEWELIRPGIFLFGGRPSQSAPNPLPVIAVKAAVTSVRTVRAGETVSYAGQWRATRDSIIATLPMGYADGIPRSLSSDAYVLIKGSRCPIVGRITMDMTMVNVSEVRDVRAGDIATLIGRDHSDEIELEAFAGWCDTVSYEALTRLGSRLPRIYSQSL